MTGQWLRELRMEAGLSQEKLAARVGLHRNSIALYESGADPPLSVFLNICAALGVKPWKLVAEMLKAGGDETSD